MIEQQKQFWELISVLDESKVIDHVVLVGSWAEFIYERADVLSGYFSMMKTMDVDFLLVNIRRPTENTDLLGKLKERGYQISQSLQGYSIIQKEFLEVEFLVCEKGAGKLEPYALPNLGGIKAIGLRYMSLLSENSIEVEMEGLKLNVPTPAAYCLHKILINSRRSEKKQAKDIDSVRLILQYIGKSKTETARMQSIYDSLPKTWQKEIQKSIKANDLSVPLI